MTVSYSNYGYYPRNPRKEVGTDIVLGTAAGAVGVGLANAGVQKLTLKYPDKAFKMFAKIQNCGFFREKLTGRWVMFFQGEMQKVNWATAGKAALVGGAAIGVLTGLISAIKKLPKSQ